MQASWIPYSGSEYVGSQIRSRQARWGKQTCDGLASEPGACTFASTSCPADLTCPHTQVLMMAFWQRLMEGPSTMKTPSNLPVPKSLIFYLVKLERETHPDWDHSMCCSVGRQRTNQLNDFDACTGCKKAACSKMKSQPNAVYPWQPW